MEPPCVPRGLPAHTPFYCEENVYRLAQGLTTAAPDVAHAWELSAVFVSNENKAVVLWRQDAGGGDDDGAARPVVWDYHCVLVVRPRACVDVDGAQAWVYDYNSRLGIPCPLREYIRETFKSDVCAELVPAELRSTFRVVPAEEYIARFASDRSHMLTASGEYVHPPPAHAPIVGGAARAAGVTHNLMEAFVDMCTEGVGQVLSDDAFWAWGAERAPS